MFRQKQKHCSREDSRQNAMSDSKLVQTVVGADTTTVIHTEAPVEIARSPLTMICSESISVVLVTMEVN